MLCGLDEAGRGPLAGPLVVAGVVLHKTIKQLNDSKKLSQMTREKLYKKIITSSTYHIVFKNSKEIDEKGISLCLKESILEIISTIKGYEYLIDGNTSFGIAKLHHKIKADEDVDEVSAASILAKVSRDEYMFKIASSYPNYNFKKHKGYGTKLHLEEIKQFGKSLEHRHTFKLKALS